MGKYVIDESTLIGIADAIRLKEGSSENIRVIDMKDRITSLSTGGQIQMGFPNGTVWSPSNISDESFNYIHESGGTWVACSLNSGLWYSNDGKTWSQSNVTTGSYYWCYAANGIWYAVGESVYTSTDGCSWTLVYKGTMFMCVRYANGVWATCSLNGGLHYIDETGVHASNIASGMFYHINYVNGIWVACGYGSGLYYSSDGMTWTQSNVTAGQFYRTVYENGIWIACSFGSNLGVYYSVDGITWTQSNLNNVSVHCACYGNDLWIAGCIGGLYYSSDGITWTEGFTSDSVSAFKHIEYCNGVWVACSDNGIYYSANGLDWAQSNVATGDYIYVRNANGIWVAGSSDGYGLYYSVGFEPVDEYVVDANNTKY